MIRLLFILLFPFAVQAIGIHGSDGSGNSYPVRVNSAGQLSMALQAGEDQTHDVQKVEGQFSYKGNLEADTQIKNAAGFVHTITCSGSDAAATAGTIILYDNTAESGTVIWEWNVQAVAITSPFSVILDAVAATGLYLGYTTTNDVNCTVSYR